MKYLVLIFTLLIIASCTSKEQKQTEEIEFDWLIGDWVRVGDDQFYNDTITTFEYWTRIDNIYLGKGITLTRGDTTFFEQIVLYKPDSTWALEVSGVNQETTVFRLTEFTESSFTCENPENEFPNKIEYSINKDTLHAQVSNEQLTIPFAFIKKNNLQ